MKYELNGYNIDNLLKTLYNKKIPLLNVERMAQTQVKFELPDKYDKKAQKYITNFKGEKTPSFIKRLPKLMLTHIGLIVAIFVGSLFYFFSSNYIWQIKIFGIKNLTEADIIDVLEQNGVKTGKINLKSSKEIETILLENYNRIAQVSVIRQGTTIVINLSEKLVYDEQIYEPITANHSGIITNINLVTGTTNVKIGDFVNAGDILVFPFNLDKQGNKISVKPMAEIKANIFIIGSAQMQKTETILARTGKQQIVYDYYIFGKHIFSGRNKNSFALFENVSYNENVSRLLPIKRTATCFYELAPTEISHDFDAEKQILIEKSQQNAYGLIKNTFDLLDETTKTEISGNTMYAYTTLTLQGQIND